jgi:hypothetical protein
MYNQSVYNSVTVVSICIACYFKRASNISARLAARLPVQYAECMEKLDNNAVFWAMPVIPKTTTTTTAAAAAAAATTTTTTSKQNLDSRYLVLK